VGVSGRRWSAAARLRRAPEQGLQDLVSFTNLFWPSAARDQGKNFLSLFGWDRSGPVGPHVGKLAQRNLERHRHVIQAVNRDRFFATFHFTDELAAETGPLAQPLLAQTT